MSGWDDAGELALEGIDLAVDKYYEFADDGVRANYHWAGDKVRKLRKKDPRWDPSGRYLVEIPRDLPQQGQQGNTPFRSDSRSINQADGRSQAVQRDTGTTERSRGLPRSIMGDNGYGPPESNYGRNPQGSRGYDDGYDGDGASEYRDRYRPDRPAPPYSPQTYDPSRYAPSAATGAAVGAAYGSRDQRYLPPPPAPRAYDDPRDDEYDSYDEERERRARRSKSESRLSERRDRSRSRSETRSRGGDDREEGHKKKPQRHELVAALGGAVAGGLIGHEMSSRRQKPETFTTLAGAVIGAVAAREADKWWVHRQEEKKEKERVHEERVNDRYDRKDDRYEF